MGRLVAQERLGEKRPRAAALFAQSQSDYQSIARVLLVFFPLSPSLSQSGYRRRGRKGAAACTPANEAREKSQLCIAAPFHCSALTALVVEPFPRDGIDLSVLITVVCVRANLTNILNIL
uniref:Uncharacterized protein n=1 Tax=Plectus sambesii TaxID=2011161 RepID=A0A914WLX2_9BILA